MCLQKLINGIFQQRKYHLLEMDESMFVMLISLFLSTIDENFTINEE